jgi:anaerobic selenocysteine-containing dehydrogenase
MQTKKTFCRFCHANCAMEIDIEDGRPVMARPDTSDPIYGGYTCMKGRQLPAQTNHPDRLRMSQRRLASGAYAPIASQQALDEIGQKLKEICDKYGPRAIATYSGTYAYQNSAALAAAAGFHQGIGSTSYYTSITIDQPAKTFTWSRVGAWQGTSQGFNDADVFMIIGGNPITSHACAVGNMLAINPSHRIRVAKKRGLKLICIDPRRTAVAGLADIHLQVRPGEDPTLLAGILKVILDEGLHDHAFCERYVSGLPELRAGIAGFTPDYVAERADVPAAGVIAAARLFAKGPRGIAYTGTGPEMALRGSLTEHLVMALNIVCGRFCREGDLAASAKVLCPPAVPPKAQVSPPQPLWGEGFPQARVRGLTQLGWEMPTATLADEILTPGDGQIRALLCIGGNPLVAWPNQAKVERAMRALDLLVCVDIKMSQTAKLAHYVVAPKLSLEREDMTVLAEWWYEVPYARYTEAVIPPQGDVIDEWEFFWELAQRLGTRIETPAGPLPTDRKPSKFEVLEKIAFNSHVALSRIRAETEGGGKIFPEAAIRVQPGDKNATGKFQLAPAGVVQEILAVRSEALDTSGRRLEANWAATHLLVSRRTRQFFNSAGHDLDVLRAKGVTNYAHMHPQDMATHALADDSVIEIATPHASILGVVKASEELKPGVISMAHAFGGRGDDESSVRAFGSATNRLINDEVDYDSITGQCRQSAIPVRIRVHIDNSRAA